MDLAVDDNEIEVTIWDTAGQEDYSRVRQFCFDGVNCFLLCFALDQRESFDNVEAKVMDLIQVAQRN